MEFKKGVKELIFVSIIILVGLVIKSYFNNEIRYRGDVSKAFISKVWVTKKPVFTRLEYYYIINGDSFFTYYDADNGVDYQKLKQLEGRTVLLVYDSTDVKANRLLLVESDFERYAIPYPDSMKWLNTLLGK